MPLYDVFLPGQEFPLNPNLITGGLSATAGIAQQVGMLIQGVNAASAAAAGALVQGAVVGTYTGAAGGPGNQQGFMHINTQSTNTNV